MLLIVGLGNPGKEYEKTRHNVGFLAVDALAAQWGARWKEKKNAAVAEAYVDGSKVMLVKPLTFMNNAGEALGGLRADAVWAIYDDVAIDLGTVRVRLGGSAGGHNGVKSLMQHLGENFWRIRIGIGPQTPQMPLEAFVLQRFSAEQRKVITTSIKAAAELVARHVHTGLHETTLRINDAARP